MLTLVLIDYLMAMNYGGGELYFADFDDHLR
jgi:hypothetical protein